jgi:V/A-type H+-transporting ATPase subunit E
MAEELKALLDKIQKEGIETARQEAGLIHERAQKEADEILLGARNEAKKLLEDAGQKIRQERESSAAALKQTGRDVVLSLKKQIIATLDKIVALDARQALSPQELADLIKLAVQQYGTQDSRAVLVSLKDEDRRRLEENFLSQLKNDLKKNIILESSEELKGGFIISFDEGKSHFDFSDKALAAYLAGLVRPKLAELLK